MKNFVAIVLVSGLLTSAPVPLLTSLAVAKKSDEICMARMTNGRQKGDRDAVIIVKKSKRQSLKKRGFRIVNCKGKSFHHEEYKREICKFAGATPAKVQLDFKKMHGATPSELCAAAR